MPTFCLENLIDTILHPSSVFPYLFYCELIPNLLNCCPKAIKKILEWRNTTWFWRTSQRGSMGFKSGEDGGKNKHMIICFHAFDQYEYRNVGVEVLVSKGRRMLRTVFLIFWEEFESWARDRVWVQVEGEKEENISIFFTAIMVMQRSSYRALHKGWY